MPEQEEEIKAELDTIQLLANCENKLKQVEEQLNQANQAIEAYQGLANKLLKACQTAQIADPVIAKIALSEAIAFATGNKSSLVVLARDEFNRLKESKPQ